MSSDSEKPTIVVIKRVVKKNAHHGGAWKIAYADFVTAMMSFFLLMWLLSMVNKYQLNGISNYFKTPLKSIIVSDKNTQVGVGASDHEMKYKVAQIQHEQAKLDAKAEADKKLNEEEELKQSIKLKEKMEHDLEQNASVKQYKDHLTFEVVKDGLRVNFHELENKPMFSLGKTDFETYADTILKWLTQEINDSNRKIMIIGHTDTNQYVGAEGYTNWELSADRANATRRTLIEHSLDEKQILRVQGAADSLLLDKKNGTNSINRRIEIIMLSDTAVQRIQGE